MLPSLQTLKEPISGVSMDRETCLDLLSPSLPQILRAFHGPNISPLSMTPISKDSIPFSFCQKKGASTLAN